MTSGGKRKGSIDPTLLIPMDRTTALPGDDFNVLFIGAGNIMFGSDQGPWNHSFRFEHKLGPRLKVVALVDPARDRCEQVLKAKRESFVVSAYQDTKICMNLKEFVDGMTESEKPRAVIIGCPPAFRGSTQPGKDIELKVLQHFPGIAIFVEKPVATGDTSEAFKVAKHIEDAGNVCSVGYMLRYLRAVQMMKEIIQKNNLTVMATTARYIASYEKINNSNWWDKSIMCGPIVEQGTHFCDLSRYFGGDVDIPTVQALSVEHYEKPGKLSKIPIDEAKINEENRIPRVTSATWKYKNGAVGSLTHVVGLQGTAYACEMEVFCDGYQLKLVDPYNNPELHVRRPGNDREETYRFSDDDPFFSEVSNLIDTIEHPGSGEILSDYEDACKTYEFTWAIRNESERTRRRPNLN